MRIEQTPLGTVFCRFDGALDAAVARPSFIGEVDQPARYAFVSDIRKGWANRDSSIGLELPERRLSVVGLHLADRLNRLGAAGIIHPDSQPLRYDQMQKMADPKLKGFILDKLLTQIVEFSAVTERPNLDRVV